MRLKSYFAGTVEAAMALAREEMGPEAMLVQSKRTTSETRHIGRYEVVFALPAGPPPEPEPEVPKPEFAPIFAAQRDTSIGRLSSDLEELKKRIETMSGVLDTPVRPARNPVMESLVGAEVEPEIARAIATSKGVGAHDPSSVRRAVEALITVDASLGVANSDRRIVALVGPPGAGKTSALVKLATRYGLAARRSMHFLSTDVFRAGAAEQLRLYASILGVSFQAVETPLALAQALEENRRKDLIFIDTPGWPRRESPEIEDLARFVGNDPGIDVHLVLPASYRAQDLARAADRYAIFRPAKLLFTRLDESSRFGPLLNETCRARKPLSFLSAGEQIPEDLEPASSARIADLVLGSGEAN